MRVIRKAVRKARNVWQNVRYRVWIHFHPGKKTRQRRRFAARISA